MTPPPLTLTIYNTKYWHDTPNRLLIIWIPKKKITHWPIQKGGRVSAPFFLQTPNMITYVSVHYTSRLFHCLFQNPPSATNMSMKSSQPLADTTTSVCIGVYPSSIVYMAYTIPLTYKDCTVIAAILNYLNLHWRDS